MNQVWETVRYEASERNRHIDAIINLNSVDILDSKQLVPDFEKKLKQVVTVREDNDKKILNEVSLTFEDLSNNV